MKDKFDGVTDEELEKELKRRKIGEPPEFLPPEEMDWTRVIENINENIDCVKENGWEMKDFYHYLAEDVLKVVFGEYDVPKYYKWLKNAKGEY